MIIPAFCLAHLEPYDRADPHECIHCYYEEICDDLDRQIEDSGDVVQTAKAEIGIEIRDDVRISRTTTKILTHASDYIDDIKDSEREELISMIEELLNEFIDDVVEWS